MKTPEQMAEEYAETVWDESELAPEDKAVERHVAIGKHSTQIGFLAGYQAAKVETNLPTSAKWISVKEQMPAANICVLIAQDKTIWVSGYCDTLKTWGWYENGETCRPTHWMPLPEPPKEGK